jgi:acetyl-CoA carboxylase biotin carboxyl carrier protein
MIGTFFHAPEPGAPPFVAVGDSVVPGQQIGILEVMKMMSSVEAHVAGTVREILVPDGGAVEFQQALIVVEPATAR